VQSEKKGGRFQKLLGTPSGQRTTECSGFSLRLMLLLPFSAFNKPNSDKNVKECDAIGLDSSTVRRIQKKKTVST
jgi:hypothetical protein